jgi:TonB family protein
LDTAKGEVFIEAEVDERPEIVWGPALEYPQDLRERGIQGHVVVQAIIDQGGRVEPESIKFIESPNSGFEGPVRDYMLRAEFHPAKYKGRRVRVLVNIPIDFKIRTPN